MGGVAPPSLRGQNNAMFPGNLERKQCEAKKRKASAEEIRIAQEAVAQSREYVQGFHVTVQFGTVVYSRQVLSILKKFGGDV